MNQQVSENNAIDDDAGISLAQVIEFVSGEWKRLAAGAGVGLLLGVGGWAVLASYKAEQILVNNPRAGGEGAINFLSWRGLQQNLPLLAAQLVEQKKIKPEDEAQYRAMSGAAWWAKNVKPTYSLTKGDTKDFAAISKSLQDDATTILNLVVTANGSSKDAAMAHVSTATQFIKQGSAYLSVKNLISGWEYQTLNTEATLQKKITDTEVDLKFMRQRAANLESMRQRFPQNVTVSTQQVVDLKDSSAKYMPISTQLVAVNTDINNANEMLERMRNELAQTKVMGEFVAQAKPIVDLSADGLAVIEKLLAVSQGLRTSNPDINGQQVLNTIDAELVSVRTSFQRSLEADLMPQVSRSGVVQPAAGGLVVGGVLMLLYALGCRAVAAYKAKGA